MTSPLVRLRDAIVAGEFPPSCCTAWEDCKIDGVCHDPETCGAVGPNQRDDADED
jgi:hypothetical protein